MAQAVSRRSGTAETRVRFQICLCVIRGGLSGTERLFSPTDYFFPCQYYSTILRVAPIRMTKERGSFLDTVPTH